MPLMGWSRCLLTQTAARSGHILSLSTDARPSCERGVTYWSSSTVWSDGQKDYRNSPNRRRAPFTPPDVIHGPIDRADQVFGRKQPSQISAPQTAHSGLFPRPNHFVGEGILSIALCCLPPLPLPLGRGRSGRA